MISKFLALYRNVENSSIDVNKVKELFFLECDIQFDETGCSKLLFKRNFY